MSRLRRKAVPWGVGTACLVAAGCGTAANAGSGVDGAGAAIRADPLSCVPVEPALASGATMAEMAGRYQLALVLPGDPPRATAGLLTLRDRAPGSPSPPGSAAPLMGFTDVALDEVSAYRVGDPASEDAAAPGALVLESDGRGGRSILIRLGSQANRLGQVAFDGAFTVLRVRRIDAGGFAGSWESGTAEGRVGGHFCAVRNGG